MALSVAVGQGAEAVVCASTGNTSASMAAYAARAGVKPLVLVPQGKISAGKLAQAILHGAQVIMVRGNFDDCLRISRGLAEHYPVALVNSVNPMRLQGQKTASFEIVDFLGDAPDVHVLPTGNAGNISAYWLGYREAHQAGDSTKLPVMRGWQAAGAAPLVIGAPVPDPETVASAIRIGNPASWDLAVEAADQSGGKFRQVTDAEILAAQRELASRDGVFVEPASAAGVAGLLLEASEGVRYAGQQVVVTVTGHGLKDIDTALSTFTDLVDTVCDADVDAAAAAGRAGLRWRSSTGRSPSRCPATSANLGPGFDCLGLALELADTLVGRGRSRAGSRSRVDGEGADEVPLRRDATSWSARCGPPSRRWASSPPGCTCAAPTGSRTAAGSARRRPRSSAGSCWRGRSSRAGRTRLDDAAGAGAGQPASRVTPTTSRPALLGGFVICGQAGDEVWAQQSPVDPSISAVVFVPPHGVRTEVARGLLPGRRAARRRGGQHRSRGPARRGARRAPATAAGAPPRTSCTSSTASPRCRSRSPWSRRCAARGVPAVISGAGPTVLAFVDGDDAGAAASRPRPAGWRALRQGVGGPGARVLM